MMKKVYEKPKLYAESFELMEHIAGNCLVNEQFNGAHHRDASSCNYSDDNLILFVSDSLGCMTSLFSTVGGISANDSMDTIKQKIRDIGMECYNSFLTTGQLFAS